MRPGENLEIRIPTPDIPAGSVAGSTMLGRMPPPDHSTDDPRLARLPLRAPTPRSWAELAARQLPRFLSDHAVCEQQAAVSALSLVGKYPDERDEATSPLPHALAWPPVDGS